MRRIAHIHDGVRSVFRTCQTDDDGRQNTRHNRRQRRDNREFKVRGFFDRKRLFNHRIARLGALNAFFGVRD